VAATVGLEVELVEGEAGTEVGGTNPEETQIVVVISTVSVTYDNSVSHTTTGPSLLW
jgi:hypothetical protein